MRRGIEMEATAAIAYARHAKQDKVNLFPAGLIINPKCPWLGSSPDRKVYDIEAETNGMLPFGLLEIKVVKEGSVNFDNVQYLQRDRTTNQLSLKRNHLYFLQVQCQLALSGLECCDLSSYINDTTYHCGRITFDKQFFQQHKDKVIFNFYLN